MLRVLDLFSGIGGFSLGLERTGGFRTVQFVEIDPFCQRVLAKQWPDVPCHDDVRTFDASGSIQPDIIVGGFPCQPFSHAGQRRGAEDDRHLWPQMARIVDEFRPTWVCGENVAGIINMGLDKVLSNLEAMGYAARPFVVPACAVDAPHRRDRVWIVAHRNGARRDRVAEYEICARRNAAEPSRDANSHAHIQSQPARPIDAEASGMPGDVADDARGQWCREQASRTSVRQSQRADRECGGSIAVSDSGCRSGEGPRRSIGGGSSPVWWQPEPDVGRVANGVPSRVDRLRALGNAVVPAVVEQIGRAILKAESEA